MCRIKISKTALKHFKKLPIKEQLLIKSKVLKLLINNPFPRNNNPKKLKGQDRYRLRAGNYRVLYKINDQVIFILQFSHRKDAY